MTELQVYWWLMLDNVQNIAQIMGIFIGATATVSIIVTTVAAFSESEPKYLLFWLLYVPVITVCMAFSLVPNSKQYAMIKVFPKIANSEVAQEIPDDMRQLYDMAKSYMKEMLLTKKGESK